MRAPAKIISGFFRKFHTPLAAIIFGAAFTLIAAQGALACACCSNTAWRNVEIEKLEGSKLALVSEIAFAKAAKLMLGEANEDGIKGVVDPEEDYTLSMARQKDRMVFSLRDAKGRGGNLTLTLPKTISIFEVDPRDSKDEGSGPLLYKEWKLNTNAAGDGIFRATTGGNQKMTLVLHGRGNGCTDSGQFSHWSLLVYGPAGKYTFYGDLDSRGK